MRILIAISIGLSALAQAQETSTPEIPPMPPGPPIQARAPEHSQWSIAVTDSAPPTSDAPANAAQPKKAGSLTTVTKSSKTMRRLTLTGEGRPWETWCVGDLQITIYPDGTTLTQSRPIDLGFPNLFYVDYSQSDFPEFWWVSKGNYAGIKGHGGVPCLYYKDELKLYHDDSEASKLEAYVDMKTRLPVLLIANTSSKTYTFSASADDLELPEVVQTVLKQRAKAASIATRTLPVLAP